MFKCNSSFYKITMLTGISNSTKETYKETSVQRNHFADGSVENVGFIIFTACECKPENLLNLPELLEKAIKEYDLKLKLYILRYTATTITWQVS